MLVAALYVAVGAGQTAPGQVTRVKVPGIGLEGNLAGDSPDRDVTVYLRPSYVKSPNRRYPVLPSSERGGEVQQSVLGRLAANATVMMVDQYIWPLKKLKAIVIGMGEKDGLLPSFSRHLAFTGQR